MHLKIIDDFAISIIYSSSEAEKVQAIDKLLVGNTLSVQLLKRLAQQYRLMIRFTDSNLISQGCWIPDKAEIQIKSSLSLEAMLQTLLFECCNALNPQFKGLDKKKFNHSRTAFATYVEEVEHQSYLLAYWIYQYGIETSNWPRPANIERFEESLSLDVWMKKARQKNNLYKGFASHFDIYSTFFHHKDISEKNLFEKEACLLQQKTRFIA